MDTGYELDGISPSIEFRNSLRLLLISISHDTQQQPLLSIVALGEKGSFA